MTKTGESTTTALGVDEIKDRVGTGWGGRVRAAALCVMWHKEA